MGRPLKVVLEAQRKYGQGGQCTICGQPTNGLSVKCEPCIERMHYMSQLDYAREWLRRWPTVAIELAHDKKHHVHLVLFRNPELAWCGARVSQLRAKRVKAVREKFPLGLCALCLTEYEGML